MNNIRRTKRILAFGGTAVVGALAAASLAFACTQPTGQTYWGDGTTAARTLARGTSVSAFALGAIEGIPYKLVVGSSTGSHAPHACMDVAGFINNATVYADAFGTISTVAGTVPSITPGAYKVCFRDSSSDNWATTGLNLTVT